MAFDQMKLFGGRRFDAAGFGFAPFGGDAADDIARPLADMPFAPNPGALLAKSFVPSGLIAGAPLIVVLHGCTQTAAGYDRGTGWSYLAQTHGFAVLYPEQQRANNPNGCFNWFKPGDIRRGGGEAASIKAAIDAMIAAHRLDPARVYITGLSAGAAMAGVMLATYPEMFAGGGLIAGLPYGVARSVPAAFSRMRARGPQSDWQLARLVRNASGHNGPWPTISVWHGTADATVSAANADATVAQWRGVHAISDGAMSEDLIDGYRRRQWRDAAGRLCVEEYVIDGMGHGTPLDPASAGGREIAGAYLLDVGSSSTQRLAASWGLTGGAVGAADTSTHRHAPPPAPAAPPAASRAQVPAVIAPTAAVREAAAARPGECRG